MIIKIVVAQGKRKHQYAFEELTEKWKARYNTEKDLSRYGRREKVVHSSTIGMCKSVNSFKCE